jgi:cytochrome subunit of sulfide dehydrogenase
LISAKKKSRSRLKIKFTFVSRISCAKIPRYKNAEVKNKSKKRLPSGSLLFLCGPYKIVAHIIHPHGVRMISLQSIHMKRLSKSAHDVNHDDMRRVEMKMWMRKKVMICGFVAAMTAMAPVLYAQAPTSAPVAVPTPATAVVPVPKPVAAPGAAVTTPAQAPAAVPAPPPAPSFAAPNITPNGARSLAANCAACHGTNGNSAGGAIAGLAGMNQDYLIGQMKLFKEGKREATVMHQIAKGYSDAEVTALANYFAAQKK